jgi:hypothetical protein
MNDSTLFISALSLFFGFGCGAGVIRNIKGTNMAKLKLAGMIIVTAVITFIQYYKYRSFVDAEAEFIKIMEPIFFGSIAFGALLSCTVYGLVKDA